MRTLLRFSFRHLQHWKPQRNLPLEILNFSLFACLQNARKSINGLQIAKESDFVLIAARLSSNPVRAEILSEISN